MGSSRRTKHIDARASAQLSSTGTNPRPRRRHDRRQNDRHEDLPQRTEAICKGIEGLKFGNQRQDNTRNENDTRQCTKNVRISQQSVKSPEASRDAIRIDLAEEEVLCEGLKCIHFGQVRQEKVGKETNISRFRGNFGVSHVAVANLLRDLQLLLDKQDQIKKFCVRYFFLTLHWLYAYPTYSVLEGPWNVCQEVIGKTVRCYVTAIQKLKKHKIKWFEDGEVDENDVFLVSVDGIHCRTYEVRSDPGKKWYSHKSHGAGLAYELALAIRSSRLVWINGPFPASKSDITIFRYGDGDESNPGRNLRDMIPAGKRAVADSGYRGEDGLSCAVTRQSDSSNVKEFKARAKSRQEVFNSKVKAFACTAIEFRHGIQLHAAAFESVCILLQYDMECGHVLFEV